MQITGTVKIYEVELKAHERNLAVKLTFVKSEKRTIEDNEKTQLL